jgi:hypothetical protein
MKKLIYLLVILLMVSACKKENKDAVNSPQNISISNDVINKLNHYQPDFNNFDT